MPKSSNQKLKQLYLMDILYERTDETHSITMQEMIAALSEYGIAAERKSLYDDIEALRTYGMDIIMTQERKSFSYRVGNRPFELAELKLLVDSVQAAKFITAKKSNELIKKIENLASRYEATKLQRQVYVAERIKTANEAILYNVDMLHAAIAENSKIRFQYFQWNVKKQMQLRRDGAYYELSPWALSWDDEYYYLIAYDGEEGKIKHFRVDKMLNITTTGNVREGRQVFSSFDPAVYAKKYFGMFEGTEEQVKLLCENGLAGVILDRFGMEVPMIPVDEGHFTTTVRVAVSRHFLSWVMAIGEGIRIIGPVSVVEKMRGETERLVSQYR